MAYKDAVKRAQEAKAKKLLKPEGVGASRSAVMAKQSAAEKAAADKIAADEAAKAQSQAAIDAAGASARQMGEGLRSQAAGLSLEKFGFGQSDLDKAAELRKQIYQGQQSSLLGRQGAQRREMSEALQRRLQSSGLRGSGTAERLAQVQGRELAAQEGEQLGALKTAQAAQEIGSIESERAQKASLQQFIEQSQARANELATNLESAGVEAERARQFASSEADKQRAFQQDVVLKMQSDQFKQQFNESVRQFESQMKQRLKEFDLDKEVTRFNMQLAQSEAGKKGIFDRLGQVGSDIWKGLGFGGDPTGGIIPGGPNTTFIDPTGGALSGGLI